MKLYELPRGSLFKLVEPATTPPDLPDEQVYDCVYKLTNIDGMYSHCTCPATGEVYHFAAWTKVEEV